MALHPMSIADVAASALVSAPASVPVSAPAMRMQAMITTTAAIDPARPTHAVAGSSWWECLLPQMGCAGATLPPPGAYYG